MSSLRDRLTEWSLRNDISYDEMFLVDNDGSGWLTWFRNDNTEPMLRPLGRTKVFEGHVYSPVIRMPGYFEFHSKTRKKAVRMGRRLAKEEADRAVRMCGLAKP